MALEQPPHRGFGVADSPLRLGDLKDSGDGPQIGGEPVGERTSGEKVGEGGELLRRDQGGAARSRDRSEGLPPSLLDCTLPIANGGGSNSEEPRHLGLGTTLR